MQVPPPPRGIRVYIGWAMVALCSLSTAIGLALLSSYMAPCSPGTPERLWTVAWGDVDSIGFYGYVHPPRDGVFVYEIGYIHGSRLYTVPIARAEDDFKRAVAELKQNLDKENTPAWVPPSYRAWASDVDNQGRSAESLILAVNDAKWAHYIEYYPEYAVSSRQHRWEFEERWAKTRWYWANLLGEWLCLSGLILWVFWPLIRSACPLSWAIHLGSSPLLFALPVYLGYATYTFTSHGPSGGVLYPWMASIVLSGGACHSLDNWLIAHTPQLLEPLSQSIGGAIALTGRGLHGPTTVLLFSFIIAVIVYFSTHAMRYMYKRKAPSSDR